MADWSPPPRLEPRLSRLWQEWKTIPQCQLSYGLIVNLLENSRYIPLDLSAMAGETMRSSESYRAHRLSADRFLEDGNFSRYCFLLRCYPLNHMSLNFAWWRNSRSVGLRSDYEGHRSKEASKEFKILFIGIVYKATWKAMKKKAFIPLLCLPTFLHLRMRPKVHRFW